MQKAKKHFWRKYNALITLILSLLGFSTACESLDEYGAPVVEYGVPTATFIVQGKVSSQENTKISNIRVSTWSDTTYTDENGNYRVQQKSATGDQNIPVSFEDIDGVENGEFTRLDTIAKFENVEFTGGDDDWYAGEAEKQLNVKLDTKK